MILCLLLKINDIKLVPDLAETVVVGSAAFDMHIR